MFANLKQYAPALKARFSPSAPFGVGLRLSAREARELLEGDRLREFRAFLDREGLYVAIINGFPYGPFHGTPVKANVYAPDWRDDARVDYTLDLIRILQALLPEGLDGGVSTTPLSYKAWMADAGTRGVGNDDAERRARRRGARASPARAWHAHPSRHRARAGLRPREHRGVGRVLRAVAVLGRRA